MKRKLFITVLALCLLISLLPAMRMSASAAETWTYPQSDAPAEFTLGVDGTTDNAGTESNPYAISSAQDLVNFSYLVNHGSNYSGKYLALTADIVFIDDVLAADGSLNIGKSYRSCGTIGEDYSFKGNFDGQGHTISGIYININAYDYRGLFGQVENATIKNLGVIDSYIIGRDYVGGIVGYAYNSTIENCYNSGSISGTNSVGGIVGYARNSTAKNCYNSGRISGNNYVGGIVGRIINVKVNNCHNDGSISADSTVGGIVGQDFAVTGSDSLISNCYNTGTVNAVSYPGGIVGDLYVKVSNCYNTRTITASSYSAGGISGMCASNSTITACYNIGSVIASSYRVGGIAGFSSGVIELSHNCGKISSNGSEVGGITGDQSGSGTVQYCYNTGSVTGSYSVGGIVGDAGSSITVTSCYYDNQMCTSAYGIGSTSSSAGAEGKSTSAMVGANLEDSTAETSWVSTYWAFSEDDLYPRLKNMDDSDAAILSASPISLASGDKVNSVTADFTFSTVNGVEWASDNDAISIPEDSTTAGVTRGSSSDTEVILTATLGSLSRGVSLTVAHMVISGTPTIAVTGGYGDDSDQIKIGATLTATANTTPSTNLSYQWQVSSNGSDGWTDATGTGNNTVEYTVSSADVEKYLRVAVTSSDSTGMVYSAASAQVPYTITLSQSGNTGTDTVSLSDSSSVSTVYAAGGSVTIYYTLDGSGTKSNTLSYSGGSITQVTTSGTSCSSYTVSSSNAASGVIAIAAVFAHTDYGDIYGTPTITVTNGYGDSSDKIMIGATLTAMPNTTPDTSLSYQWEVSENSSAGWTNAAGTGNNTAAYTVAAEDAAKYLRVKVTSSLATSAACSTASAQVPYTITLSESGNTGTDAISFSDSSSVSTVYAIGSPVTIYYTLDDSGTKSNTLTYSGGTITQVTTSGTSSSSYTVSSGDASDGVIEITATFKHTNSSSGRGSSSSSTKTAPSSSVPVIVNGKSQTAGTSETTTENGQTKTTITVDTDKLEDILDSEDDGTTVTIPITDDTDSASGVLTGQMVKNMEEKESILEMQTSSATYTLPASEIDIEAVSEQFGENIDLSDIGVEITIAEPSADTVEIVENASENGGFSIMVQAVEFTVTCTYDGETVEVEGYTAYVERSIAIPDGVDHTKITTAVIVNPDGTVRHVPTEIVEIDGVYYAVINSLTNSVYTLINNPVEFSDAAEHWAQDAINDMGSRMVINGDENGNYNPDNDITRAEFAAIVVRALGLAEGIGGNTFSDISDEDWYCGYIETASAYGIIVGYTDGTFGPNDKISREQAMTVVAKAMKITKLESGLSDGDITTLLGNYTDAANVSEYAKESAAVCIETGIISGKGNENLAPKDNMTRAEVAVIVQRLLQKSGLI
ncbi:MAG: S-layer homology domain-containing protein [Oscillospiraceae bacterium]